jgi:hypothetical protein
MPTAPWYASGVLNHAFDAVELLRRVFRVVYVRVGFSIREQYLSVITNLGQQHLSWIEEGVVPAKLGPMPLIPSRLPSNSRGGGNVGIEARVPLMTIFASRRIAHSPLCRVSAI